MTDLKTWLAELGLERYTEVFAENDIDLRALPALTEADFKELGLSLGHRRILQQAIESPPSTARLGVPDTADAPAGRVASPVVDTGHEAERRQLTVMFADLVDSTALTRLLELEDLREVNRAYQTLATRAVERFGGCVARYMGDGIMAYFGYPIAHEDDAERAVRAGLALVDGVGAMELGALVEADVRLAARVGIATGAVVVGDLIGEGAAQEWAVVGETPNLAARVESSAEPGTVAVSPMTHRLTGGLFSYQSLGSRRLKGIDEDVQLWRPIAALDLPRRFQISGGSVMAPLVGRDDELALLVRRWESLVRGQGHAVMLCGEPGIGKSRLAEELRLRVLSGKHAFLPFQCSPHHVNSPYHPFIAHLRQEAKLADAGNRTDDRLDRVEDIASGTPEDALALTSLLGVDPMHDAQGESETPRERKERVHQGLVRWLQGVAANAPAVCLFEDLHWSDASTLEVLDQLVAEVESMHALLLLTFRPDFQPPWGGQPCTTTLTLPRMSARDSKRLVESLSGPRNLTADVAKGIVARTDGVPLFIEELTQWTTERQEQGDNAIAGMAPAPDSDVPATLRDALMGRLGQASGMAREVAQTASVIGRDFDEWLLKIVWDGEQDGLRGGLDELLRVGLVQARGHSDVASFRFKHALVRDALYESILRKRLAWLHGRIGDGLVAGARVSNQADSALVAFHLEEAGRPGDASGHWLRAGLRAASEFANRESVAHLDRFLRIVERSPALATGRDQAVAANSYIQAKMDLHGFAESDVVEAIERAAPIVRQHATPADVFDFLRLQGLRDVSAREEEASLRHSDEMVEIAARHLDATQQCVAHYARARDLYYMGRFNECIHAAQVAERLGGPFLDVNGGDRGTPVGCVAGAGFQCRAMWVIGLKAQAFDRAHALLEGTLTRRLQPSARAWATVTLTRLGYYEGLPEETKGYSTTLLELAESHGMSQRIRDASILLGWAEFATGNRRRGLERMLESFRLRGSHPQHQPELRAMIGEVMLRAGEVDSAHTWIRDALNEMGAPEGYHAAPWILATAAAVQVAHSGDGSAGLALLKNAVRLAESRGALSWSLRTALQVHRMEESGQIATELAEPLLTRLYARFTEGYESPDLVTARGILKRL